jgi:hypothetical protein
VCGPLAGDRPGQQSPRRADEDYARAWELADLMDQLDAAYPPEATKS